MGFQTEQIPALKPPEVDSGVALKVAGPARTKKRHTLLILNFIICVMLPAALGFGYLYLAAKDQFGSTLAFSIRSEEHKSPLGLLGGLGQLSTSSSADSDILYEYIQSQKLVENIDKNINLRGLYSKAKEDPVFSFDTNGSIEDLLDYWGRMVDISYDSGTQLTNIIVKAFSPEDAQLIAQEIQKESTSLINQLNLIARNDATRYAKQELDISAQKLKEARGELTRFRTTTQIIDPSANLQGQMGLLNQLEGQLAEALITGDLLIETTSSSDPRLLHADRKIEVIRNRIDAERERLAGVNGQGEGTLSTLVGDFERLSVERKFAEETYLLALSTHNTAALEAQRQSLYLAAHIEPTLAETSQYPERGLLGSLFAGFLLFGWAIITLIFYSLRDRR
jgi:capsular polysaccharide transport system permease protein